MELLLVPTLAVAPLLAGLFTLVSSAVGIFQIWGSDWKETLEKIWEFLKKYIGAVTKALAVIGTALLDLIPQFFDAVLKIAELVVENVYKVTSFNEGNPFLGGPSYALAALNAILPLDTASAALVTIGTLYVALVGLRLAKATIWLVHRVKTAIWPT